VAAQEGGARSVDPYSGAARLGGSAAHLQRASPPQPADYAAVIAVPPVQLPGSCAAGPATPPLPAPRPPLAATPPSQAPPPRRAASLRRQLFGSGEAADHDSSSSMEWAPPQPQQRSRQPRKKRVYAAGSSSSSGGSGGDGLGAFSWAQDTARQHPPLQHAYSAPESDLLQQHPAPARQQSGASSSSGMDWQPAEQQQQQQQQQQPGCLRQQQPCTLFQGPVASSAQRLPPPAGSAFAGHAFSLQSPCGGLQRHSAPQLPWATSHAAPDTPTSRSSTSSSSGLHPCPYLAARGLHAGTALPHPADHHDANALPRPFPDARTSPHAPHTPPGGIGPLPPPGHFASQAPWLASHTHAPQQQQQQSPAGQDVAGQLDMLLRLYHLGMVSAFRSAACHQSAGAQAFARAEELCHAARQQPVQPA
jgi:hypothetical protein